MLVKIFIMAWQHIHKHMFIRINNYQHPNSNKTKILTLCIFKRYITLFHFEFFFYNNQIFYICKHCYVLIPLLNYMIVDQIEQMSLHIQYMSRKIIKFEIANKQNSKWKILSVYCSACSVLYFLYDVDCT